MSRLAVDRRSGAASRGVPLLVRFVVAVALALPAAAVAQDIPDTPPRRSPFQLGGAGDFGRVGFRSTGSLAGICVSNAQGTVSPRGVGCNDTPTLRNTANGNFIMFFEQALSIAAPPSDLPEGVDASQLEGRGWTVSMRATLPNELIELLPTDRSGRDLLAFGVTATADGSCRDFSSINNGLVFVGTQLLPHSSCQATWPDPSRWQGRSRITLEGFLAAQPIINPTGDDDPFAFWRVPADLTTGLPLGDQATYGEFSDFTVELIERYPSVVPGGGGRTPLIRGWPLGLTVRFDVFYFGLPGINNAYFYQYEIINNSEEVWGQPVDYDSIYISLWRVPRNTSQQQAYFIDLPHGAWYARNCDTRRFPNATSPWTADCPGRGHVGFNSGAQGMIVFKSPIGDLRNKLLTDPTSPFYNPNHPNAGDTITFNHAHGCNFITCTNKTFGYSERALFGLVSSTLDNLLDGRDPNNVNDFTDAEYFNIVFPTEVWPTRGDFNKYVPGVHDSKPIWDYNKDGVPDTLYIDQCGSRGCVPVWEDTLPGGWTNLQGQVAPISIGPFRLGAGDTTGLIFAYIADRDSASFVSTVQNVYDLYLNFFLVPEAAPAPVLTSAGLFIQGGASGGDRDTAQVRLNWNDRVREHRDRFLLKLAEDMVAADPGSDLGKIYVLNPWVLDSLQARAADNVAALYVFKSCDGGTTFTDDADCLPDPVDPADQTSKWATFGWLPWATLPPDANSVLDDDVLAGLTYLYSVVTETRGARWTILQDQGSGPVPTDAAGNPICDPSRCQAVEFEFAPSILSALEKTPDASSVVTAYVPLSRQGGRAPAAVAVTSPLAGALVPVTVTPTEGVRDGTYRAVFADTLLVTTVVTARAVGGGRMDTTNVALTVTTNTGASFSGNAPLTMRGATLVSSETVEDPADPAVLTTTTVHRIVAGSQGAVPMLLVETSAGNRPLLASGVLTPGNTTPGSFLDRSDFPGFIIDVDAARGGSFNQQAYRVDGRAIPVGVTQNVTLEWLPGSSAPLRPGAQSQYRITWSDRPFGPAEPFALGSGTAQTFANSLGSRAAGSTSVADPALADVINAALEAANRTPVEGLALAAYELPFTITNVTENRPVQVAVISHRESVLLGTVPDTQTVSVPAGRWVAGDRLVLLESIDGQLVPTWDVVIGCGSGVGITCNPIAGSSYVPIAVSGAELDVSYFRPLAAGLEFTVEVTAPRKVASLARADLRAIQVVPNPYVVFSQFERADGQNALKFTHVPETGRLRIYTVTGQFVQEIRWTADDLDGNGDLQWNMTTRENTALAYGLYIWVLDSPDGTARGKFVVIR